MSPQHTLHPKLPRLLPLPFRRGEGWGEGLLGVVYPAVLALLLWPAVSFGSPASALREYQAGKYDQALKEYEQLLKRKSDDPRLHFNTGAAAYRNRQFEAAAKQFNETLSSPDLKLQGQAYYNEGNALYHLGEQNPDSKKRTEVWEKAIQDYQSSLKLSPKDTDARFNYEFVKKKLEELKQQQQQSKQDKNDKQDKQDDKQNQDQQQNQQQEDKQKQQDQQQQQQDQQKQEQQQQQAKQDQKQDSSQQQKADQQKQQDQSEKEKQAGKQSKPEKQDQQQAQQSSAQPKEKSDEKEQEAAAAQAQGQMTQEQAQQLLDAQKGDEKMLPLKPTGKPQDRSRPTKDW